MGNPRPSIRFAEFTGDWEQQKLGDISELITKGTTPKDKSGIGEVNFIKVENINPDNGDIINTSQISMEEHKGYLKRSQLRENDILLSIAGTLGRIGVVKSSILPANTNQALAIIRLKESVIEYVTTVLKGKTVENFIKRTPTVGAQPNLSLEQVNELKIPFPNKEEQMQIGNYFQSLDRLITLHQRKVEKLQRMKKAMLEKMFPKAGALVPEIRFAGFTGDWERRKLSELSEKTFGGGTPKTSNESFWEGNIPWIQSSDLTDGKLFDIVPRKYISTEAINKSATKLIPENSITIVTRVGVGKLAFIPFSYTTSQDFLSLSELKTKPQFTVYTLYKKLQSELNAVQGTSIKGITKEELLTKEVMIPCYEEQEKIGEYFSSLDNLITLHQRKVEKLQRMKKAMLEKMFV